MKHILRWINRIFVIAIFFITANLYTLTKLFKDIEKSGRHEKLLPQGLGIDLVLVLFLVCNSIPDVSNLKLKTKKLRHCGQGLELLCMFLSVTVLTGIYTIIGYFGVYGTGSLKDSTRMWLIHTLIAVLVCAIIFWNGIIRVYLTSTQLGIRIRLLGIICGWIPIVHLIVLGMIIKTVSAEVKFENHKILENEKRASERVCKTKYPLLLVHGVFFRDFRYLNYWGRIPKELENNGAIVYYGNQQSAASVEECGRQLAFRIQEILRETGAKKVNIIAHSKGGLDSRFAISMAGAAPYVASLTTINTPHRGCEFADYLLTKIDERKQQAVANAYNAALSRLGDYHPDFLAAVNDLTAGACHSFNSQVKDAPGVFYQSIGSKLNVAGGGRFPLNFSYYLVKYFDGANDGLVGEKSFPWGERFRYLTVNGRRGISHGDVIDLNRENIKEFDVREFYVQLVADLKKRGF